MSGRSDEIEEDPEASGKRRRVQRACDICRKKKIRCDGLQPEKGACSNCASYGLDCTFADAVKRRAPPRSYIIALEARMAKAEEVIGQIAPFLDISKVLGPMPQLPCDKKEGDEEAHAGPSAIETGNDPPSKDQDTHAGLPASAMSFIGMRGEEDEDEEDEYEEEEDEDAAYLQTKINNITLESDDRNPGLIAAVHKKRPETNQEFFRLEPGVQTMSTLQASAHPRGFNVPLQFLGRASAFHLLPLLNKRMAQVGASAASFPNCEGPEMSSVLADGGLDPQQIDDEDYSSYDFRWPTEEEKSLLIDGYFRRANRDFPVLNETVTRNMLSKPTSQWKQGEMMALALAVFALASRYRDDTASNAGARGMHWYKTMRTLQTAIYPRLGTTLIYLQGAVLGIIFISAVPQSTSVQSWVSLSAIVRLLEDCGAHRKFTAKRLGHSLLTEETYKRLWWVVYVLDRQLSCDLGRPMAIQDEDFDLDDILLVNDDVLVRASEEKKDAVQPAGQMCVYEGFLQVARLSQIVGKTLRTIYAISKSKISRGFVGRKWDALVVADIDKSLSRWLEEVPDHLRYNPGESDAELLLQSSRVFVHYYHTQTLIHRPFIQSEKMDHSDLTFQSLAIVSNASRSAIHIVDNLVQRGLAGETHAETPVRMFAFACVLLLISWSAQIRHLRVSSSSLHDVRKGLDILDSMRHRWPMAVALHWMLELVIQRSAIPVAKAKESGSSNKRSYKAEDSALLKEEGKDNESPEEAINRDTDVRTFRSLPASGVSKLADHLPFSTMELQSDFVGSSPDSTSAKRASSSPTTAPGQTASAQYQQNESSLANIYPEGWSQPHFTLGQGQTPLPSSGITDSTSNLQYGNAMDPTIFDPPSRSFHMGSEASQPAPGTSNLPYDQTGFDSHTLRNFETGLTDESQLMNGLLGDPLSALVNMQTLWSDADWIRALDS